ncbi:hypothetical protein PARC_p0119 (plasmid) [Pseudoalteromonas arctica A 37-1-2]|uniref:Uncharacterized protein n=1 Tax=Pseudoalteromonas arctica A 37-1-2 TaxID=1117313 RepID=A0A290SGN8_9GAMM|nr:hypothetical protein PARC_p0119 [Pseudoalteromonas arctica A 37-1-2]
MPETDIGITSLEAKIARYEHSHLFFVLCSDLLVLITK